MTQLTVLGMRTGQTLPRLMDRIAASRDAGRRVIVLVPEQYTLQAEQELIDGLRVPGLMDVEAVSPRRLHLRVREAAGAPDLPELNERGRVMLLSRILLRKKNDLRCYGASAARPGLADRFADVLTELEELGQNADWLAERAERAPGRLTQVKLRDIALVWKEYEEAMRGRFLGSAQEQEVTRTRLRASGFADGADVYVCGFDRLNVPFCELLLEIARCAFSCTVAMTLCGDEDPDRRAFRAQSDSVRWLLARAGEAGVPARYRYIGIDRSGADPALRHLERRLFAPMAAPFDGACEALRLHTAADPYAEAEFAASQLKAWHQAGIPWDEMGVALCQSARLPAILAMVLRKAEIPCYVIRKESAARHGLCRMLTAALKSMATGYDQKQVLSYLDSGFSPLTDEESVRLRAYAERNGIRWKKWTSPFTRGADAEEMEPLREKAIAPLTALREDLDKSRDGAAAAEAAWRLLRSTGCYDRLLAREELLLANRLDAEVSQNRQIWRVVLELLDQLHTLFAGERLALNDLARIVEAGLNGIALSSLPPSPDRVTVGETGHMLTGRMQALLVMGMQDGVTAGASDSLLTDDEQAYLADRRPSGRDRATVSALRHSDFYRTLTLPSRFLTVTLSSGGTDGKALRPSLLTDELKRLFPRMRCTGGAAADGLADPPLSAAQAAERLPLLLRRASERGEQVPEVWLDALRTLWQTPELRPLALEVEKALHARIGAEPLSPGAVDALFRQNDLSISRLETFAGCPFRHFVQEGLAPEQRREFTFEADERGDFYHAVLARYAALAAAHPRWPDLTDEEIAALVEEAVAPEREKWAGGPLTEDGIGEATAEEAIRTVSRTAWVFTVHARQSGFRTDGAEVRFGEPGGLPPVVLRLADGRAVALRGVIDRVDRWEGDGGVFLRVVDYKSSDRTLDPVRMFYGLQLQLMLYLQAVTRGMGGVPAGAYYFQVKDPLVASDTDIIAAVQADLAKAFRLKGVTLAEAEVIRAMNGDSGSAIIGQVLRKDGSVSQNAMAADRAGMQALMDHSRHTAEALADRLYAGDIGIRPARDKKGSACDHCAYKGICGWDARLPGAEYRDLEQADAWERMTAYDP